jgi:peptidoglycan L-alanyl-D-glutamate endopeptidase CwlK
MSRSIDDLDPTMQPKARTFLSLIKIPYVVTSTLRTADEQVALYAQGRAPLAIVNLLRKKAGMGPTTEGENAKTITLCDGVNTLSNHQGGKAMDVVPANMNGSPIWPNPADPRWLQIATAGKAAGLTWGGDWPQFKDYPHYQED